MADSLAIMVKLHLVAFRVLQPNENCTATSVMRQVCERRGAG